MKKRFGYIAALLSLLAGGPVAATTIDKLLGTVFVKFSEQRREGRFEGCSMEYSSLFRDHTYAQGAVYALFGSFSVTMHSSGVPLMGLKVGTQRAVAKSDGSGLEFKPERPNFAYLSNDNGVNNAKAMINSMDSDTEGARFFVFDFLADESSTIAATLSTTNKVNIVFNRRKDGTDISIPIDLTVVNTKDDGKRTRNLSQMMAYDKCVLKVLNEAQKILEKK